MFWMMFDDWFFVSWINDGNFANEETLWFMDMVDEMADERVVVNYNQ